MKGVNFIVDEKGRKTAVVLDLDLHGEVWEDFYDRMLAKERQDEPRETLEAVKARLVSQGKLKIDG